MEDTFEISMERIDDFEFEVDFGLDGAATLRMDEPPPLGGGDGPNAARLLAAAVGNCLASSALFCIEKARIPVRGMRATVRASLARNERGRLRIRGIEAYIHPRLDEEGLERMGRCLDLFEDFCMVTESVRTGIPVSVDVIPETESRSATEGRALV